MYKMGRVNAALVSDGSWASLQDETAICDRDVTGVVATRPIPNQTGY
jgi:hypothetical protein